MTNESIEFVTQKLVLDAIAQHQPALVLFDYFDTIVSRKIHPEDVKRMACERLAAVMGAAELGCGLYEHRHRIEAKQCQANLDAGLDAEFRIREMLGQLWDEVPQLQSTPRMDFVEMAVQLELGIECAQQVPDPEIVAVIASLVAQGTPCWVVSDFYMSGADMRAFLACHGLADLISRVEVSSDHLLTKRSGRLYQKIIADALCAADQMVMIGDNPHSDRESAQQNGILALHIDREAQHQRYAAMTRASNSGDGLEDDLRTLFSADVTHFKEMALTLYLFIERLYNDLIGRGIRDIFFLSREGQFLKTLFDNYQDIRHAAGAWRIKSHYLEVSRRSTFLPSLRPLDEERFETLFRQYRRISLLEFLSSLGLQEFIGELTDCSDLDFAERSDDLPTSAAFATLLNSRHFREVYDRERLRRRDAFVCYLNGFDREASSGELNIVDVGWKGTIQDNLFRLVSQVSSGYSAVKGHYVGLVAPGLQAEANIKRGHVFTSVLANSKNFDIFNENRALFEVLLGADHGSVRSYEQGNGEVAIIRDAFAEQDLYEQKVAPLQREFLRLFTSIAEIAQRHIYPQKRLELATTHAHARMVLDPTDSEVEWFEGVYHVENFGVFENSKFLGDGRQASFLAGMRFYIALRRGRLADALGFWPWLTCRRQGGRWVAARYALSRRRNIEI